MHGRLFALCANWRARAHTPGARFAAELGAQLNHMMSSHQFALKMARSTRASGRGGERAEQAGGRPVSGRRHEDALAHRG
eukprot:3092724-Alexandrium_andersonii.AAC.1